MKENQWKQGFLFFYAQQRPLKHIIHDNQLHWKDLDNVLWLRTAYENVQKRINFHFRHLCIYLEEFCKLLEHDYSWIPDLCFLILKCQHLGTQQERIIISTCSCTLYFTWIWWGLPWEPQLADIKWIVKISFH